MQTSKWGKPAWDTMFYVAAGYDLNTLPDSVKRPQYKGFFQSMGLVLPCKYCRASYVDFFNSLDFDEYSRYPCGIVRFVYDIKNLVNEKLMEQERLYLQEEYDKLIAEGTPPDDPDFWDVMREKAQAKVCTKPAPPFKEVMAKLAQDRAECSDKMKTCRDPYNR